ncbi:MAG: 50S ribosomal protein L13 [Chloroflexi bacterium]|nr:50S ribosomal protein L13 [Chloroflexota bacterium]
MAPPKAQRTWTPRAGEVNRAWRVVDAEGKSLGRLASEVAQYLRGKHLPTFAEHMDLGDFVIVLNARRIRVTGNKLQQKMYYRHSGYPGGFKAVALGDMLERHPDRVVKHAVKGMLPHNALGRKILRKLKIYDGPTHPHAGQLNAGTKVAREATPTPRAATAAADRDTSAGSAAPADAEPVTTASTEEPTA